MSALREGGPIASGEAFHAAVIAIDHCGIYGEWPRGRYLL